ncbi:MAG: ABC transporter substrate-binding protein, partial [Alphaproteobacteria bacterium]
SAVAVAAMAGATAQAKDTIKVGVVSFLTGPAAGPFGVPGKNGAELVIDAINAGTLPAPHNTKGFAGATLNPVYTDEAGGNSKQVAEYRNLVQKQEVDSIVGYISSGSCMAMAPVAEELKKLTVMSVCGTPRLFEEKNRDYVFRTQSNAVGDSIAAARYMAEKFPEMNTYSGINQNYAWGQDSWKFFDLAMKHLNKDAKPSSNPQFPKIFSGQYSAEISTLALDSSQVVHTSFWDGDIEAFVLQALVRGFFNDKKVVSVVGGSAVDSLGKKFPDGVVMGTRGPYGLMNRTDMARPLNKWFVTEYKKRYGAYPLGPSYQYAKAVLFLKLGMDKAAKDAGAFPTQAQVIAAMKNMKFESFGGSVKMALGAGHQAIHEVGYGITKWDKEKKEATATDVKYYDAECINPPAGTLASEWLAQGMPGAKC